jgi:hypothetical protein
MAFICEVKSKKEVTVKFWRVISFSFNRANSLTVGVEGFVDEDAYAKGADPVDKLDIVFNDAETHIKEPFYELVEKHIPLFKGAIKNLAHSRGRWPGPRTATVQSPRGDLIESVIFDPAIDAEPSEVLSDNGEPEPAASGQPHNTEPQEVFLDPAAAPSHAEFPAAQQSTCAG